MNDPGLRLLRPMAPMSIGYGCSEVVALPMLFRLAITLLGLHAHQFCPLAFHKVKMS